MNRLSVNVIPIGSVVSNEAIERIMSGITSLNTTPIEQNLPGFQIEKNGNDIIISGGHLNLEKSEIHFSNEPFTNNVYNSYYNALSWGWEHGIVLLYCNAKELMESKDLQWNVCRIRSTMQSVGRGNNVILFMDNVDDVMDIYDESSLANTQIGIYSALTRSPYNKTCLKPAYKEYPKRSNYELAQQHESFCSRATNRHLQIPKNVCCHTMLYSVSGFIELLNALSKELFNKKIYLNFSTNNLFNSMTNRNNEQVNNSDMKEIRIAVVGTISSGKTYLLKDFNGAFNKMIDENLIERCAACDGYTSLADIRTTDVDRGTPFYACCKKYVFSDVYETRDNKQIRVSFLNVPGEAFRETRDNINMRIETYARFSRVMRNGLNCFKMQSWRYHYNEEEVIKLVFFGETLETISRYDNELYEIINITNDDEGEKTELVKDYFKDKKDFFKGREDLLLLLMPKFKGICDKTLDIRDAFKDCVGTIADNNFNNAPDFYRKQYDYNELARRLIYYDKEEDEDLDSVKLFDNLFDYNADTVIMAMNDAIGQITQDFNTEGIGIFKQIISPNDPANVGSLYFYYFLQKADDIICCENFIKPTNGMDENNHEEGNAGINGISLREICSSIKELKAPLLTKEGTGRFREIKKLIKKMKSRNKKDKYRFYYASKGWDLILQRNYFENLNIDNPNEVYAIFLNNVLRHVLEDGNNMWWNDFEIRETFEDDFRLSGVDNLRNAIINPADVIRVYNQGDRVIPHHFYLIGTPIDAGYNVLKNNEGRYDVILNRDGRACVGSLQLLADVLKRHGITIYDGLHESLLYCFGIGGDK